MAVPWARPTGGLGSLLLFFFVFLEHKLGALYQEVD